MASGRLSFANGWSMLFRLCNIINVQFHTLSDGTALSTAGNNFTSLLDTFTQNLGGSRSRRILDNYQLMRQDSVDFLIRAREVMRDIILELARSDEVDSPAGDDFARAFRDVWLHMHNNNTWVRRRVAGFGSASMGGGNAGDGVWYRCTKDKKNYDNEQVTADITSINCIADRASGASSGLEQFELYGQTAGQDILEQLGTGSRNVITAASEANSLLDTPSFEGDFSASGTTLIGNWETDDASDFTRSTTAYRGTYSAQFDAASTYIRQAVTGLDRTVPYLALARVKDATGITGTMRLTLGAKTADLTLGQDNSWHDLYIALDDDCWPDNFIASSGITYFQLHCTALSGGTPLVDTTILRPMQAFNGVHHAITAGATDWRVDDTGTYTDSFSNIGVVQFWTKLLLGLYWPHKPTGSYNLSDPTLV